MTKQDKAFDKLAEANNKFEGKKPAVKKPKKESLVSGTNLVTGSTRSRLFHALRKFPKGLSASQIKEKCEMLKNSGHLAVLLTEETEAKRIKVEKHDVDGVDRLSYKLTAKGLKDLESGVVDRRKISGRFGQKWTKARWDGQIAVPVRKPVKKRIPKPKAEPVPDTPF